MFTQRNADWSSSLIDSASSAKCVVTQATMKRAPWRLFGACNVWIVCFRFPQVLDFRSAEKWADKIRSKQMKTALSMGYHVRSLKSKPKSKKIPNYSQKVSSANMTSF